MRHNLKHVPVKHSYRKTSCLTLKYKDGVDLYLIFGGHP